jgi:small subunit ribosomal protein S8
MTDPIADMLTRVRNAQASGHSEVFIPFSKIKYAVAKTLEEEGFFSKVEKTLARQKDANDKFYELKISLKYQDNQPFIKEIKRISKPGCRLYAGCQNFHLSNYKTIIVSTNRGIMTARQARRRRLGGEIICEIG